MAKTFSFFAISPEGFTLEESLIKLSIETEAGQIEILPDHDNLVSTISFSRAKAWTTPSEAKELMIRHGILSVDRSAGQVKLMAFSIIYSADISIKTLEEYYSSLTAELTKENLSASQRLYLSEQSASLVKMLEVTKSKK